MYYSVIYLLGNGDAQRQAPRRLAIFRMFCWDFPVTMIIVTAVLCPATTSRQHRETLEMLE
jgi:hypothetical protein